MSRLEIRHRTTYGYAHPVDLGVHRLMLRPRESRDVRLHAHRITFTPEATLSWALDIRGNAIASASFAAPSDTLTVDSLATVELCADRWPIFPIDVDAVSYPFRYTDDQWIDLGALAMPTHDDPDGRIATWARGFVAATPTDTLSLLQDVSHGVTAAALYRIRDDEGTQTPSDTLDLASGSCRDMAVLFVDAVRRLGFGARIVSGYIHDPDQHLLGSTGSGSTHAWAEVFLPGAGWITFDPTNRSMGGFNLIPVAVGRRIDQVAPVSGTFAGPREAFRQLTVEVVVTTMPDSQPRLG